MTTGVMRVTLAELCELEGLSRTLVLRLVEYDIARPVSGDSEENWVFDASGAHWMSRAIRLQRDLELDWVAVAMLVDLLRQREQLDRENRLLRQRLERFLAE